MSQIGGKSAKSSSTSKRHFTIVIGKKEHGLYVSSSPSSAARKAVSKLCAKEKSKKVEFCLREITQGSKKKTYGPYLGHIEKLSKPIELKGRVIERKPVALLKPKSSAKKGGMQGGGIFDNIMRKIRGRQPNNNSSIEMKTKTITTGTNGNRIEEEFIKEIAESFAMNRPFMMPNREREIEKQNKYKNIPKETRKELKILGFNMSKAINLQAKHNKRMGMGKKDRRNS